MKFDFNTELIGLDGKVIEGPKGEPGRPLNIILATSLVSSGGKENILKFFDWGLKLQNGGILDLDRTDRKLLRSTIENFELMNILAKARILGILDSKKEEELTKTEE